MKLKTNILIIALLLTSWSSVSAFTLAPAKFEPEPSKISQFFSTVWKCKWRISCYSPQLGTFTQISGSNTLNTFPTTYNANLAITVETGTTSVASITTLSNLASIGTITTGIWSGTTLTVAKGGTGSTTPSGILWGDAAGAYTSIANGSSGQFLKSNGTSKPSFETTSVDQAATYNWTGIHDFAKATTTNATTTSLQVSGLASTSRMIVGALGVGVATTTQRNAEIAGDAQISGATSIGGNLSFGGTITGSITKLIGFGRGGSYTVSIPANSLGTANVLEIIGTATSTADADGSSFSISATYGGSTFCPASSLSYAATAESLGGTFTMFLVGDGATNAQSGHCNLIQVTDQGGPATSVYSVTDARAIAVDSTVAQNLVITASGGSGATGAIGIVSVKILK